MNKSSLDVDLAQQLLLFFRRVLDLVVVHVQGNLFVPLPHHLLIISANYETALFTLAG